MSCWCCFFIHPSMMNFVDFHYNSFTIVSAMETHLMVIINWQLCDNSCQHKAMFSICKWYLSDYYGIITRWVHPLTNLMFAWIFYSSINKLNVAWFFIHPLTSKVCWCPLHICLIMGFNVDAWQLILVVLNK
jgi:hypothetical protein